MKNGKIFLLILILLGACKKPYNPKVINSPNSYLIVEGVINTNDSTSIKLSRTVNLSNKTTTNPVTGARLVIEDEDKLTYGLVENGDGIYKLRGETLNGTKKYRLNIKIDGQEYYSDYEQAKTTPPIDSIGYTTTGNKLQIYLNTHDPKNDTRYYRFDYVETWRFHAKYDSEYHTDGMFIVPRHQNPQTGLDETVFYCFQGDASSSITLASTAKLKQDVLYQQPLTAIAPASEKISLKYSILVHQYALTPAAYTFWSNLKKNTEQLGSIFDAAPSELTGNIHNVANPAEPVIGFISVCTVQAKRIFIDKDNLPSSWFTTYPYDCALDSMWFDNPHDHVNQVAQSLIPGSEIPTIPFYTTGDPNAKGYLASSIECTDCTIRGTKKVPDFWK